MILDMILSDTTEEMLERVLINIKIYLSSIFDGRIENIFKTANKMEVENSAHVEKISFSLITPRSKRMYTSRITQ